MPAPQPQEAVFAGGCFWCLEAAFEQHPAVLEAVSGYTGGDMPHPTYQQVSTGHTGHYEAVLVRYDPEGIAYERLLEIFWRHIDPTDTGGQFYDRGSQYRTAIFYRDEAQRALAEASKARLEAAAIFPKPIATRILPAKPFYPAENYHQDYHRTHAEHYRTYHLASGREAFFNEVWQRHAHFRLFPERLDYWKGYRKPPVAALRAMLTPLQFAVTQENATERPFDNAYWNHHEAGIYVDVVSGEPLFASLHKYDAGSGWPSFTQPLDKAFIVARVDRSHGMVRTEVRSRFADSHLGHVFGDGPPPTGSRYCINSAALRFIGADALDAEGYGAFATLFA